MNNYEFGKLLKLVRQSKNWTQEQLALKLDVTVSAVSKWETGKNLPDLETISKLSKVLSISIEDLLNPQEMLAYLEGKTSVQPKTSARFKLFVRNHARVIASSFILLIIISLGITLYSHSHDTPESYIVQVAFRITEDEQCGTVYEVACVYNIDLDDVSLTSPYIDSLSSDWHNNNSVQSDITIMKLSFYSTEQNARQWDKPEKSIYLIR